MKTIYVMLTQTNTVLCKTIGLYTRQPYAHVSLLVNDSFRDGYSFSRKNVKNPFIGGFMKEDYITWMEVFPKTACRIYKINIDNETYDALLEDLELYYKHREKYKYDFVALIGQIFGIDIERKNRYFCSCFVAYILDKHKILEFDKRQINIRPADFSQHEELDLIYEGKLKALLN